MGPLAASAGAPRLGLLRIRPALRLHPAQAAGQSNCMGLEPPARPPADPPTAAAHPLPHPRPCSRRGGGAALPYGRP